MRDGFARAGQIGFHQKLMQLAERGNHAVRQNGAASRRKPFLLRRRNVAGNSDERLQQGIFCRVFDQLAFDLLRHVAQRDARRRDTASNPFFSNTSVSETTLGTPRNRARMSS